MTMNTPELSEREAQACYAIGATLPMSELGRAVPLAGEVFDWLAQRGIAPAGPPFWRYLTIEMPDRLEIECGVPVGAAVAGDERVRAGELPAGRYATVLHIGHPDDLVETTRQLLEWADREGLVLDASPDQRYWGCRLEEYLTDPEEEPDMRQWVTRVSMRLA
jgi:effector-binding domain-containing protein